MNWRAAFFFRRAFGPNARTTCALRVLFLLSGAAALALALMPWSSRAEPSALAGAQNNGLRLLPPVVQGTDLWLGIEGAEPAGWYDLFSVTNLDAGSPWRWEMRSAAPGQTGFLVPHVFLPSCFFQLATLLDSDADLLTDAYELLVLKTDPQLSDTDGDGVGDYAEFLQGRNPRAGAVPDSQGVVRLRVFTPMP